MSEGNSVSHAPKQAVVREVTANDAALPTEKRFGVAVADYDEVVVNGVLKGGATAATITLFFWSAAAAAFLRDATAQALALTGGNSRRAIFRVAHSDSVFFEVTALTGARVDVEVSGVPVYDRT